MSQWVAWILAAALIIAGVAWRSWPLISSGAAVLGFPGIVPQQTESNLVAIGTGSVGLPEVLDRERGTVQETMITRGGNMFGKRKQEAEVKVEEKSQAVDPNHPNGVDLDGFLYSLADSVVGPETDESVFLPEDGENQTITREEFVKNIGLEKS